MNVYFQGSSQAEIKKSYRKLSLILHPDKETGNEKAFMKLTKGKIFVSYPLLEIMKEAMYRQCIFVQDGFIPNKLSYVFYRLL
jgi:preprotein translocase subunit Sec63